METNDINKIRENEKSEYILSIKVNVKKCLVGQEVNSFQIDAEMKATDLRKLIQTSVSGAIQGLADGIDHDEDYDE